MRLTVSLSRPQGTPFTYDDASNVIATVDAPPSENVSYSYDRLALQNPETSIMLVAALLAHYAGMASPLYDPQTRMEHAMLIYVAGSTRYTLDWQPGGKYLGPSRGNDGLYHPTTPGYGKAASASVNRFLVIIDQLEPH